MAYRFTNTDKWGDSWFSKLRVNEKLLFMYLCDSCDVGGFIEINKAIWSVHTGMTINAIDGALVGLERGIIISQTEDCIYIKNFLKHQKNTPLNENNNAHRGIIRRFELYAHKFEIQDISLFIEGASKGLLSPIGNGNGKKGESEGDDVAYRFNKFYDHQIGDGSNSRYLAFVEYLFGKNPTEKSLSKVLKLEDQMLPNQFKNLLETYSVELIKEKLLSMENSDKLKYKSLYLTLGNWCRLELKRRSGK